jgi:hypothetical protein
MRKTDRRNQIVREQELLEQTHSGLIVSRRSHLVVASPRNSLQR